MPGDPAVPPGRRGGKEEPELKEQAATIKAARSRLTGALGREPTIQEISRQTGFTPEEIALGRNGHRRHGSPSSGNRGTKASRWKNVLTDTESEERMVEKIALRQAISGLPERERMYHSAAVFHGLFQQRGGGG